jgi:hypothetical protein
LCGRPAPAQGAARSAPGRPELADIVQLFGSELESKHRLRSEQRAALRAIARCRTPALGGHLERCDRCGATRAVYHSCRSRHCPKCQNVAKERWLAARRAELLPVRYFHVVFTLDHTLNSLARCHPRVLYGLLFETAWKTLRTFAESRPGGEPGMTAVLHTWGQTLSYHIHLHCLVPAGALTPGGARWVPVQGGFLFPVRALSAVFRAKYLEALEGAFDGDLLDGVEREDFHRLLRKARRRKWVVYAKGCLAGPDAVLDYLARYTHRVALTNDRLLALREGRVRFRWKDYADARREKEMELEGTEFLARFLLHVLPKGFPRIRHYGLLANRRKDQKLQRCRELLGQQQREEVREEPLAALMLRVTSLDITLCPYCRTGHLRQVALLPPLLGPIDALPRAPPNIPPEPAP